MITGIDNVLKKHPFIRRMLEVLMVLFMALYPLRHIHIGLDLWDTGYNYANFEYMGLDSMDSMWFFSTYLSTAVGHLFTLLPFGKTVLGLNFYTGLTVSVMAVAAYMFCTRAIKLPKFLTFLGEYVAICLCWCPTALLYNYLTYMFMLMAVIGLYFGLWKNRSHCLILAGAALGLNVFVRFSNLPEAILIFAVWVYGILESVGKTRTESDVVKKREFKNGFKRTARRTLLCMFGYFSTVGAMLLYFGVRYGFDSYFKAIARLFAMTGEASDYTAVSMVKTLVSWYIEASYWFSRMAVFAVGGIVVCALAKYLDIQYNLKLKISGKTAAKRFTFLRMAYLVSIIFAGVALLWLYKKKFSFGYYGEYGSILMPSAVLMLMSVIACLYQIFRPKNGLDNRLMAGLILIVVLVTPIGSNTGIYPVINNQFLIAPFLVYNFWKLLKVRDGEGISRYNFNNPLIRRENNQRRKTYEIIWSYISLFPVKAVLIMFCGLSIVQITTFGKEFVFNEARNAWDTYYSVGSDSTLRSIRMNYDKASNYAQLYEFIKAEGVGDNTLITYGNIPAISFYLQMPAAFNPWIDLDSYNEAILAQDLENLTNELESEYALLVSGSEESRLEVIKDNIGKNDEQDAEGTGTVRRADVYPVIIVAAKYADYLNIEDAEAAANDESLDEDVRNSAGKIAKDRKWKRMTDFISDLNYELRFVNGTYAVLIAADEVTEQ